MDIFKVGDIVRLKERYMKTSLKAHLNNHGYKTQGLTVKYAQDSYIFFDSAVPNQSILGSFYSVHFELDTEYGKGTRNPALTAIEKKVKMMWERQPFFADYLKYVQKDRV